MPSQHHQMPQPPETVLEAVAEAAEMWGAEWQPGDRGGRLRLPVVHGLRRGIVRGTLRAEPASAGTALFFDIEDASYSVNKSAFAILLLGGIGGLILVLWPLSMSMLQLAPLGAVLALVAWLLVVSRLRNSDTVDFFEQVADLAQDL